MPLRPKNRCSNFKRYWTTFADEPKSKSRDYKERQVDRKKRKVFVTAHVVLRTAAMFLASALNRGSHSPEILKKETNTGGGEILLFRALANNMAPMTNADESSTNRLTLFWLNISLFVVSTLCLNGVFSFSLSCFVLEIFRFSKYANWVSPDIIYSRIMNCIYKLIHIFGCNWQNLFRLVIR